MGDWSALAPGVVAGGGVQIGRASFVGLGAKIVDHISIGHDTVIGAGALVLEDIADRIVAYGSPCRRVRERKPDEAYL
jgi:acetyltransferase-like isoleucine patch superfamily enzyme